LGIYSTPIGVDHTQGGHLRRGDLADFERMLDLLVHNPELRRRAAIRERQRIQSEYL
jgi:hypothetical protein